MESKQVSRAGMIALVGETNAGKSTLINALLGTKVSIVTSKPHTTRNRVLGILNEGNSQLVLVDTPGFVRAAAKNQMGKFTSRVLRESASGVDLILVVVDAAVFAKRPNRIKELILSLRERGLDQPAVVALNKVDIVRKDLLLPVIAELDRSFREERNEVIECVPISALKNDGLDVLKEIIISKLPEGEALFPDDVITDQPEQFLASEVVREKLMALLNQEVPHSTAVRVEQWEEDEKLLHIEAVILVEKDSQKAIVIGKGGSRIKQVGELARKDLEELFDTKIFLKLFVKVERDWTKTEKGLARAGYQL